VFAQEPLVAESPFWGMPQVLVTPHIAGVSTRKYWERLTALFLENWASYRAGAPMRHVVDRETGY
jgi:phosphoglycerate dehydrogenase-like enzyme